MGKEKKEKRSKGKRSKEKKRKKEKKSKHRHRSSSPSESSVSSDGERLGINKRLQMGRAAARATREILAYNPSLRKELRELVRQLDGGGALEVSSIPDDFLRSRLLMLLGNLVQLRKNSAGQYFKRAGAASTVLSFVAPILGEGEEQLASYRTACQRHTAARAAAEAEEAAREQQEVAAQQQQQEEEEEEGDEGRAAAAAAAGLQIGPVRPPQGHQQQQQQEQEWEGLVSNGGDDDDEGQVVGPIGPAMPLPGVLPAAGAGNDEEAGEEEEEEDGMAGARRVGPALPPAEWLAAAAAMEYPVSEEGRQEEEEEDDDFLVGPPPPEMAEELDLACMDERTAEVFRVLRLLHLHESKHAKSSVTEKAQKPLDAYEVLGLGENSPAGEVKKRYWRLSLLIHPDKCEHPRAHDAFQAVTAAAKELQDAGLRTRVDARRQEAALRREFAAQAAQAERERQWRLARGQATAEDLAGPAKGPGPLERDTWMTELPPERRADAAAAQPSGPFTGFSLKGVKSRGNTSGWTLTPQQRAAQLENGSAGDGPGGGPLLLTTTGGADGTDVGVAAANPAQAARMAAAVDAFNLHTRKKSLLEVHAERRVGGDKCKKKRTDKGKAADLGYDPTQHPWRPFDREKDLGLGLDAKAKAADLLKGERALASKFGGGQGGSRTFL